MQQAEYPSISHAMIPVTMGHTFSTHSHQAPSTPLESEYFSAQTLQTSVPCTENKEREGKGRKEKRKKRKKKRKKNTYRYFVQSLLISPQISEPASGAPSSMRGGRHRWSVKRHGLLVSD